MEQLTTSKKLFECIDYDSEGRYLVMHNHRASKYYKLNVSFILLFLGTSYWTYKQHSAVFWSDRFAKVYLGAIGLSLAGLWLFANKHVQSLHLLKGQKSIGVTTFSNFGLSYNRMQTIPISEIKGSRLVWTQSMNVFFLEYNFKGKVTQLTK